MRFLNLCGIKALVIMISLSALPQCCTYAQQLVLNEFSQGSSGTKEYMELVVVGTKTCTDSCMDIRNWIFDDHNGWYGASTGMGIATGCMRFANNANWSCVPYGSVIVVYNNIDKNTSITMPDDPADANNDNVYIVPANDPLIEKHSSSPVSPSSATYVYPSTGFTAGGNWTTIGMANTGDAVVITSPLNLGAAHFSMTYGNVGGGTIHINASGAGDVYYLSNNQFNVAASWLIGSAGVNETPGMPNTTANAAWINGLRNAAGGGASFTNINQTICQGDVFNFNGTLLNATGVYVDTFLSMNGCDSIVQLDLNVKPAPAQPIMTSNSPLCEGTTLNLTAASSPGVTYTWSGPAGFFSTTQNPDRSSVLPVHSGYYKVLVSLDGCHKTDSLNVVVHALPVVTANNDTFICPRKSVPLHATGGINYIWSPASGLSCTNCADPVATPLITTEYVVAVSDTNNCTVNEAVKITVDDINAAFTVNKDTLCGSENLELTNTSAGSVGLYEWSFGDNNFAATADAVHSYANPGHYEVTLVVTSDSSCRDTATRGIVVLPFPSVNFSFKDSILCEGRTARIAGDFTPGFGNISWDFGDGFEGFDKPETQHAYDTAGVFMVSVKVLYKNCPDQAAAKTIQVNPFPRVDIGRDTFICPGNSAIKLEDIYAASNRRYQWNSGDTTAAIYVRHHGIYTVNVTAGNGCSTSDSVEVFKSCYMDIPNAFTPDGDGTNDYFFPRQSLSRQLTKFRMQVFSRWGQLIFETNNINGRGWDGRFNDIAQPVGVYIYLIDAEIDGKWPERYEGNVTLLR